MASLPWAAEKQVHTVAKEPTNNCNKQMHDFLLAVSWVSMEGQPERSYAAELGLSPLKGQWGAEPSAVAR
jgi:hypothetical protein